MSAIMQLPEKGKKQSDISEAFQTLLGPALKARNVQQIGWWIVDGYFQGFRDFRVVNLEEGELEMSFEDDEGHLNLRWDEPITKLQTEVGRLSKLDTSAVAEKREHTLESLRNASMSQIVLDQVESQGNSDLMKIRFLTGIAMYGTYGQASWPDGSLQSPLAHVHELIPPWELLSIPAETMNPTDVRALVRTRLFPLLQLATMPGVKLPTSREEGLLEIVELPYGADSSGRQVAGPGLGGAGTFKDLFDEEPGGRTSKANERRSRSPEKVTEKFVRLRELYVYKGNEQEVARYVAMAGRAIVLDQDYINDGLRVPMPIGIGKYEEVGRFYGRSFAGKLIPFALELESLLERLIQNVADMDRFGYLMVPNTLGIDLEDFKATEGPRIVPYEPDLASDRLRVEAVQPISASDIPGRTMQFGVDLLDRITAQGPLLQGQASGRADSGVAFNVLNQTGSTHLLPVAVRIESAYVQRFRSILFNVKQRFATGGQSQQGLELTKIDNSIAGIKLNSKTGRLELEPNSLPDPFEVSLKIKSRDPISGDRRRQEALQMLQGGMLTPLEFIILNYKENWDYPVGNRAVWSNYLRAVIVNLILFNDGETPGDLPFADKEMGRVGTPFNDAFDRPEVHLLAIEDFTTGEEFALASLDVQNAFFQRLTDIKASMGIRLPDQLPQLDQAAAQSVANNNAVQQQQRAAAAGQQAQQRQPRPSAG